MLPAPHRFFCISSSIEVGFVSDTMQQEPVHSPSPGLHCRICPRESCEDLTATMCGHIFCNRYALSHRSPLHIVKFACDIAVSRKQSWRIRDAQFAAHQLCCTACSGLIYRYEVATRVLGAVYIPVLGIIQQGQYYYYARWPRCGLEPI